MKKRIILLLLLGLLLVSCQGFPAAQPAPGSVSPLNTLQPLPPEVEKPAVTSTPAPIRFTQPTAAPTDDAAIQAVQDYIAVLQAGNYIEAAQRLSRYSLMVEEITRTEAAEKLKARLAGEKWSNIQVLSASPYDRKTTLVHVTYQVERKDPKTGELIRTNANEQWPLRLENQKWLVNDDLLIDLHTLNVPEQTLNGLTIMPRRIAIYSDAVRLTLLVQNRSNEPIVLGQPNEIMAAFLYGDKQVEAEKTRFIFDRLRSYPDVTIELKQPMSTYPDGIIIRQWKNYKVAPWFTFQFSQ